MSVTKMILTEVEEDDSVRDVLADFVQNAALLLEVPVTVSRGKFIRVLEMEGESDFLDLIDEFDQETLYLLMV